MGDGIKLGFFFWKGFRMGDGINQFVVRFGGSLGWVTELSLLWLRLETV